MIFFKRYNTIVEAKGKKINTPLICSVDEIPNRALFVEEEEPGMDSYIDMTSDKQFIKNDGSYIKIGRTDGTREKVIISSNAISANLYSGDTTISSLELGDEIISIGDSAFIGCTSLTNVKLNNVQTIGINSFRDCSSLTEITIVPTITKLGSGAFHGCTGLTAITIDSAKFASTDFALIANNTSVRKAYFSGSTCNYTFTDKITSIGRNFGYQDTYITSLKANNISSLGREAFYGCTGIKEIYLPSLKYIGYQTLLGCSGVKSVYLPKLETIDRNGMSNFSSFTGVLSLPKVKTLSAGAISNCGATEIYTPMAQSLGEYAYGVTTTLQKVTISGKVTQLYTVFRECYSLKHIYFLGTLSAFRAIAKNNYWALYVPNSCIIHCTDKNITIAKL